MSANINIKLEGRLEFLKYSIKIVQWLYVLSCIRLVVNFIRSFVQNQHCIYYTLLKIIYYIYVLPFKHQTFVGTSMYIISEAPRDSMYIYNSQTTRVSRFIYLMLMKVLTITVLSFLVIILVLHNSCIILFSKNCQINIDVSGNHQWFLIISIIRNWKPLVFRKSWHRCTLKLSCFGKHNIGIYVNLWRFCNHAIIGASRHWGAVEIITK